MSVSYKLWIFKYFRNCLWRAYWPSRHYYVLLQCKETFEPFQIGCKVFKDMENFSETQVGLQNYTNLELQAKHDEFLRSIRAFRFWLIYHKWKNFEPLSLSKNINFSTFQHVWLYIKKIFPSNWFRQSDNAFHHNLKVFRLWKFSDFSNFSKSISLGKVVDFFVTNWDL